ncbi:hypothetical protein A2U01_0111069, partial [Trifolium medium]|nr:hypothetical protein [Trifolium medium]
MAFELAVFVKVSCWLMGCYRVGGRSHRLSLSLDCWCESVSMLAVFVQGVV